MAKSKTASTYASELKRMIKERTGANMEAWLMPQVRATASNMVILDKIQVELEGVKSFVSVVDGSTGQKKSEVSPLLPHYDKLQRTLLMQFEALGLNYSTTPSKVKEDTRKGVDEKDPMVRYYETKKT